MNRNTYPPTKNHTISNETSSNNYPYYFTPIYLENQILDWIFNQTKIRVSKPICESLKSGQTLCKLINALKANTIKKINIGTGMFAYRENIASFIKACEVFGLTDDLSRFQDNLMSDRDNLIFQVLLNLMKLTAIERERPSSPIPSSPSLYNNNNNINSNGIGGGSGSTPNSPSVPRPTPPVVKRIGLVNTNPQQNTNTNSSSSSNEASSITKPMISMLSSNTSSPMFNSTSKISSKSRIFAPTPNPTFNNNNTTTITTTIPQKETEPTTEVIISPRKKPPPLISRSNTMNENNTSSPQFSRHGQQSTSYNDLNKFNNNSSNSNSYSNSYNLQNNNNNKEEIPEEVIQQEIKKPGPPLPPRFKPPTPTPTLNKENSQSDLIDDQNNNNNIEYNVENNNNNNNNVTIVEKEIKEDSPPSSPTQTQTATPTFEEPITTPIVQPTPVIPPSPNPIIFNNNSNNNNSNPLKGGTLKQPPISVPINVNNSFNTISSPNTIPIPQNTISILPGNNSLFTPPISTPSQPIPQNTIIQQQQPIYNNNNYSTSPPQNQINASLKKPRSSTKQKLEKFFSKTKLTTNTPKSPQLHSSGGISTPPQPSTPPINGQMSARDQLTSSTRSNTILRKNNSTDEIDHPFPINGSNNISSSLSNSIGRGQGQQFNINNQNLSNDNLVSSIGSDQDYNNNNNRSEDMEDDDSSSPYSTMSDSELTQELMKAINQIEFLYKDRKILKERINFTYPDKYKSFVIYDELLKLDQSPTFTTNQMLSLPLRKQLEFCRTEERRFLSEIFTLKNVLNVVEENKALSIRTEEMQKMIDSLIIEKKSLSARFDELLGTMAQSEQNRIDEEGIIFSDYKGKLEIKGGNTEKLIERLYNKNIIGPVTEYVDTFLITYRSFTTSKKVMEMLKKTYDEHADVEGESERQFQIEQENLAKKKIRLRICNFLKRWAELFFHDFDTDLIHEYNQFIQNCNDQNLSSLLQRTLDKKLNAADGGTLFFSTKSPTFNKNAPAPILPKPPIVSLDDIDPVEIARQLTISEFELFRNVASKELLSLSWQKSDKDKRSPNLLRMIHRFNEVSNWVVYTIVREGNLKKRAHHLKRFIKLTEELRKLNNFNCVFVVVAALYSASVNRLSKTWAEISKQQMKAFEEIVALTSPNSSFSAYREELHNANPPCIPYLGVHLSDLTFIEEGNPDRLENGFVNFFKCRMVAEVIKEIHQYQQQPYNLVAISDIINIITSYKVTNESDCFKLSLQAEPRESITN
ncbi:Ras guanine nucleotide exchange factor [Tieghemostelium lacteum]|uniref:Ras guanine nucleotide exchange factor n=1 Tax=Tieghemostelium lacteum TaxID=361077 RepID=A0A151Z8H5_TIELA|nr:Ras guanine nucleotide exchange factor [Tieghemostelium lacteum]|eukprot:KYQ90273.1 Ras guanine nucleotide exchange factor [Tieghemostelium lacteum]